MLARWGLEAGEPIGRGNNSLVVRCRRADGTPAVLKLSPDAEQARTELAALRGWRATGRVPAVLEADPAARALLLEAIPGEATLAQRAGAVALDDVAALIADLHRGAAARIAGGVVTLRERVEYVFAWAARRTTEPGLAAGRDLALRLCVQPTGPDVLLHGDLHPGNVLDGGPERGLVAVDPRPCVGEGAFDVVDWVFWGAHDEAAWRDRAARLAARLGHDEQRLWEWCVAFAPMLAAGRTRRAAPDAEVEALRTLR